MHKHFGLRLRRRTASYRWIISKILGVLKYAFLFAVVLKCSFKSKDYSSQKKVWHLQDSDT